MALPAANFICPTTTWLERLQMSEIARTKPANYDACKPKLARKRPKCLRGRLTIVMQQQ